MTMRFQILRWLAHTNPDYWAGQLRRPLFLIGCPRSGTTLLSQVFDLHRSVADWSEANDVWDPTGHPWTASAKKTLPVWVEPEQFTARWWEDTQPRQEEIRAIFGLYQRLRNKPFFSNKTPYNTLRVERVLDIFPEARLVNIIRDGRAVVSSHIKRTLAKIQHNPEFDNYPEIPRDRDEIALTLAKFWKFNVDRVREVDAKLQLTDRGILLDISYEELCTDMSGTLEKICKHTGLSLNGFQSKVKTIADPGRNSKWHAQFSPEVAAAITAAMQPTLSALGYA